jgi:hypothetical protein
MVPSPLQSRIRSVRSSNNGRGTGTGSSRTVYTGEKFRDWCLWQGRCRNRWPHCMYCVCVRGQLFVRSLSSYVGDWYWWHPAGRHRLRLFLRRTVYGAPTLSYIQTFMMGAVVDLASRVLESAIFISKSNVCAFDSFPYLFNGYRYNCAATITCAVGHMTCLLSTDTPVPAISLRRNFMAG